MESQSKTFFCFPKYKINISLIKHNKKVRNKKQQKQGRNDYQKQPRKSNKSALHDNNHMEALNETF